MKLYNIEFFDRNLKCTFNTAATISKLEIDYLAPQKTSIEILKTENVNPSDIVYIREFPEYVGIVDTVTQKENTTTVLIKPFVTVFDQPVMFNTSLQKGEIEFQIGWNHLSWGSTSYDNNIFFDIYLKPEKFKFGLFNAGEPGRFGFKTIENITWRYKDEESGETKDKKAQFVAKCGHNMCDPERNVVYGPRVCVDGTVSQPDVPTGAFLYYMIDSSGKTSFGDWNSSMIKGTTIQDGKELSGEEWLRKNVQLLCSPSFIFSTTNGDFYSYSAHRQRDLAIHDTDYWSFFGKDRHGRFFLGVCHSEVSAINLWDMLYKSCRITELALIGGGKIEDEIMYSTFKYTDPTDMLLAWVTREPTELVPYNVSDMVSKGSIHANIGDTFAFYEEIDEDDDNYKAPCIHGRYPDVNLTPDTSLENTIINIIRQNWISRNELYGFSDDAMMNLPIVCNRTQEDHISNTTKWTLGIQPDNQNSDGTIWPYCAVEFYSTFLQLAFKLYRIALSAEIVWNTDTTWAMSGNSIINIKIGAPQEAVHIEADLPNVKVKELIDGKASSDVNKLIVWDANVNSNDYSITFYRYNNVTVTDYIGDQVGYGTVDKDRMYPVVQKIAIVDSSSNEDDDSEKDFTMLAWEQAASTFGSIKWKNYIELEVYEPPEISLGQLCYIHYKGKIYETVLTGIKDGDAKTLIFGAYRADYTKSMIVQNYDRIAEIKRATKNAYTARSTNLGKDY